MRLRTVSFLIIIALFLVSLIAGTSRIIRVANAASYPEILDQQQTDTSRTLGSRCVAQSFKPTLTLLTRVDFYGVPNLFIYSSEMTENGLRPAYLLRSLNTPTYSGPSMWREYVFSEPVSLIPENTYFLVMYWGDPATWWASTEDLYPRGEAYLFSDAPGDPWRFWEVQSWDFPFITYGYTPTLTIHTSGVSSHSPVAVTLNGRSAGTVHDSSPLEVSDDIPWGWNGYCTVEMGIESNRIFSIDPNTRYCFASWTRSSPAWTTTDNPLTIYLSENFTFTASFRMQYLANMTFRDNGGTVDTNPTYVEALAPNGSLVAFSSFKNQWMDNGTWAIKRIIWQGSNVQPLTDPIYTSMAGGTWSINCRVFPVDFTNSFHDNSGADLHIRPSSFKLYFPNGTISTSLPLGSYLMQNGITSWSSVMWQGSEVTPSTSFDASNGNPVANCKIYSLTVDPSFYDNSGIRPITPSAWSLKSPNNTVTLLSYPVTYNQIQSGTYSIKSVMWKGRSVLSWPPTLALNSDTIWNPNIRCILPVSNFLSLSTSTSYFGFKIEIDGNLTCNEVGVSNSAILLSYSVTAGKSWNDITLLNTGSDGRYTAVWMPQATGNYIVKAAWAGNMTYPASIMTITLAVIPYQEESVFSVISNSTVSALSFESANRELSFTVSGAAGTIGYADVYIAKTLIGNIEGVEVKLNGTEIEYTATSTDDSWRIHFTYQHSMHAVAVDLGASPSQGGTTGIDALTTALVIAALAVILIVVMILTRTRRTHRKTASIGAAQ